MPYTQIKQLAAALSQTGTQASIRTELLIASQCDLLITYMLDGTEDYANRRLADLGQQLAAGERGPSLIGFGIALAEITTTE